MLQQFQSSSQSVLSRPEPREISTSYTSIILQYVMHHHPEIDLEMLINRIAENNDYYMRSAPGRMPIPVRLHHLLDPKYWTSNRVVADLTSSIEILLEDPMLGYKVGKWSPQCNAFVKNSLMIPFMGVSRALGAAAEINNKYSRVKKVEVLVNRPGWLRVRKTHRPNTILTYFMILTWIGMFESYVELAGVASPKVTVEVDPTSENAYFVDVRYSRTRLLKRVRNRLIWWALPVHTKESLIVSDQMVMEEFDQAVTEEKMEDILELQRSGIAAYYSHKIEEVLSLISKK